ncbi:MAG: RDD family protein [Candidatus Baltobacteraceae bacterium]
MYPSWREDNLCSLPHICKTMDRMVAIRTPESIAFSYELAGLGSRFLAVLVDLIIQLILVSAIFWGLVALAAHAPKTPALSSAEERTAVSIGYAILIVIVFAIFFGYFIAFETAWNGQTPGKRMLGIRVVRDGGYPIDFMCALIRNLVRTLEFGLGFYLFSAIASLLSMENKRLGDYAAGTIVVRDSQTGLPGFPVPRGVRPSLRLSEDERALIARFMDRRAALLPERRTALARQIADIVRPKVTADFAGLDDETLIERVEGFL